MSVLYGLVNTTERKEDPGAGAAMIGVGVRGEVAVVAAVALRGASMT